MDKGKIMNHVRTQPLPKLTTAQREHLADMYDWAIENSCQFFFVHRFFRVTSKKGAKREDDLIEGLEPIWEAKWLQWTDGQWQASQTIGRTTFDAMRAEMGKHMHGIVTQEIVELTEEKPEESVGLNTFF